MLYKATLLSECSYTEVALKGNACPGGHKSSHLVLANIWALLAGMQSSLCGFSERYCFNDAKDEETEKPKKYSEATKTACYTLHTKSDFSNKKSGAATPIHTLTLVLTLVQWQCSVPTHYIFYASSQHSLLKYYAFIYKALLPIHKGLSCNPDIQHLNPEIYFHMWDQTT